MIRGKGLFVIGMDIGGSKIRMAGIGPAGRIMGSMEKAVVSRQKDSVISQVVDMVQDWIKKKGKPQAIGVGVPGFLYHSSGIIHASPNFPSWHRVPFRSLLGKRLRLPLVVENDANLAALGEAWKGSGRNADTLLYLGLGTGVGGGIILNRRIWYGAEGLAGELGHITVDPRGPKCGCGNDGCLETYASATGLVRRYLEKKKYRGTPPTAEGLSRLARTGDRTALEVFSRAGEALGIAISSLINIFNPPLVVIGGRVSRAWGLFSRIMKTEIARRAIRPSYRQTRVVRGRPDDQAGILGAAAAAWQHQKFEIF